MLSVYLEADRDKRDELVLEIPGEDIRLVANSSFFYLKDDPERVVRENVRRRVGSLLIKWVRKLTALAPEQTCYLPFDFDPDNRHIGCFQARLTGAEKLLLMYGYTIAYADRPISPTDALSFELSEIDFVVDTDYEIFFAPRPALLKALNQSIEAMLTAPPAS
jgi:hypothetical protein